MSNSTEYPKRMIHPATKPGTTKPVPGTEVYNTDGSVRSVDYQGTPDRFPALDVADATEEEQYRAKGYLAFGEQQKPAIAYQEYPKMLEHPDFEAAVEPTVEFRMPDGKLVQPATPGKPAKLPPVRVESQDDQDKWEAKGYRQPGKCDPEAVQAARAAPYDPKRVKQEYPKLVGGVMVSDPGLADDGPKQYPKWITVNGHPQGGVIVKSKAEEIKLVGESPTDKVEKANAKREAALKAKAAAEAAIAEAEAELDDEDFDDDGEPEAHDAASAATSRFPDQDERDVLFAEAERLNVRIDKRWATKKIKNAIRRATRQATQAA